MKFSEFREHETHIVEALRDYSVRHPKAGYTALASFFALLLLMESGESVEVVID